MTVINALAHDSQAGNLDAEGRTGIRIGLIKPGRFTRGYYHIWLDAELTNRAYVGPTDTILRHSAPGTMTLDESRYGVQGIELGFEAVGSMRDTAVDNVGFPSHAGTGQFGYQAAWQTRDESGYGASATYDQMAISTKPGHLFSYDLSLTVSTGGYWRPRSLLRGLVSFGILGTSLFAPRPQGPGRHHRRQRRDPRRAGQGAAQRPRRALPEDRPARAGRRQPVPGPGAGHPHPDDPRRGQEADRRLDRGRPGSPGRSTGWPIRPSRWWPSQELAGDRGPGPGRGVPQQVAVDAGGCPRARRRCASGAAAVPDGQRRPERERDRIAHHGPVRQGPLPGLAGARSYTGCGSPICVR